MSRPDVDVSSLTVGAVLTTLAVSHLVAEAEGADVDLAWFAASTLVALGAVALVVGLVRSRRRRRGDDARVPDDVPVPDAAPTSDDAVEHEEDGRTGRGL